MNDRLLKVGVDLIEIERIRRALERHGDSFKDRCFTEAERAYAAAADLVLRQYPGRVTVVCGHGNNGGDGRVCARMLREAGREVTVVDGVGDLASPDVVVDALLGIGFHDAPREDAARMIE